MMMIETLSAAIKVLSYMLVSVYFGFMGFWIAVFVGHDSRDFAVPSLEGAGLG